MNKIDEIALRVAANGIGRMVSNVDICDFANALLAELSEDAEPAMTYLGKGIIDCGEHGHHNMEMHKLIPAGTPLFTSHAPVIASEQKPVAWVDVIDRHEGPYNFNGLELLDSGKHLLFTSPPNTADIEQRVAEACANVLERLAWRVKPASANEVAEELRSGKWREYP